MRMLSVSDSQTSCAQVSPTAQFALDVHGVLVAIPLWWQTFKIVTVWIVVVTSLAVHEFKLLGHVTFGSVTGLIAANAVAVNPMVQTQTNSRRYLHALFIFP